MVEKKQQTKQTILETQIKHISQHLDNIINITFYKILVPDVLRQYFPIPGTT